MLRRLMIIILTGMAFCGIFASNIVAETFEKLTPTKINLDQIVSSSPTPLTGEKDFCLIQSDNDAVTYYFGSIGADDRFALYMDPAQCGVPDPYPFKITDVHFYLHEFGCTWPVEIQVNIRDLNGGEKCNGPGDILCSQTYTIPIDSAYPNLIELNLDAFCCVQGPFFLEIHYTGPTGPPYPSFLMTDEATNPTDTCDAWVLYVSQGYPWLEWSDFWLPPPPPGYPVMRITGYTEAEECELCWYWKPDRPDQDHPAPSGMPDFDQNQDAWQAYCGPTTAANCLWWLDAVPDGWTPPQLIDTLAKYFHTHPAWGTYVDSMQIGLEQYFQNYGFALKESSFSSPDFFEMENSLKVCQNIILLLGFWWWDDVYQTWWREGGHYVTMSGVCSESLRIAISDPDRDAAVSGWPGRVRPPDHPAPGTYGPDLHNDPTFVSHDIYTSIIDPDFPSPGNPFWEIEDYIWVREKSSGRNVPVEFIAITKEAPKDDVIVWHTEVDYAVMILSHYLCGDCDGNGSIDINDAVCLINYLFLGGPPPDPLWVGDVNSDGQVDIADVVYLVVYLFLGGPPPCEP